MRDAVAHCDRVGDLYVLARDGEDSNRVVGAVRNEGQVTFFANVESGWLLANLDRANLLGRGRLQVEDVDFVVRRWLPVLAILSLCHLMCDQRNLAVWMVSNVRRRPEDAILEHNIRQDLRVLAVADVYE